MNITKKQKLFIQRPNIFIYVVELKKKVPICKNETLLEISSQPPFLIKKWEKLNLTHFQLSASPLCVQYNISSRNFIPLIYNSTTRFSQARPPLLIFPRVNNLSMLPGNDLDISDYSMYFENEIEIEI